jgi:hypothetical protein
MLFAFFCISFLNKLPHCSRYYISSANHSAELNLQCFSLFTAIFVSNLVYYLSSHAVASEATE